MIAITELEICNEYFQLEKKLANKANELNK